MGGVPASEAFSRAGNLLAGSVPPRPAVKPKALTNTQKLTKALVACHGKHGRRRVLCERAARRAYGAAHKARKRPGVAGKRRAGSA
jgi:hypothetical protein